ncbi:hypothetical protein [Enterococcus rivorum]|uniref:hypothetical protein n=1 Tax=Enterococcus rivorum TaxID=762845 RepID=UPI00363B11F7
MIPFESHYFLGKEQTESIGKCTDFNLIYKEELAGELKAYRHKESLSISSNQKYIIFALKELIIDFYQGVEKVKSCHLYNNDTIVLEKVAKRYQLLLIGQERAEIPIAVVASVV